jgi:hypothetical protein
MIFEQQRRYHQGFGERHGARVLFHLGTELGTPTARSMAGTTATERSVSGTTATARSAQSLESDESEEGEG